MRRYLAVFLLIAVALAPAASAQERDEQAVEKTKMNAGTFAGLKLRGIGPALMSGRISDIVIDQADPSTWYVAVGSGNVWKTTNAGITWQPIFENYGSYSIGCITLDPNSRSVLWLGTGENSSGRHVGYGDGVYLSRDGGESWTNMGLKGSEHIGKILVDPRDSNVVWVAAIGPLWSAGGERGLYKSSDGGKTWELSLKIDEHTGVVDVALDPRNPDVLYAAAYQRRRSVAGFMGGGPNSGIYKTTDCGANWRKLESGLPRGDVGKIGLAISPQKPDVVYATIEAPGDAGGFFRSDNCGESWKKQNSLISGGTGPHYYQELFCDPHRFDRIYSVDPNLYVSNDGGKNWDRVPQEWKHVDNHALAFHPTDPDYLLNGCDGGVYESFDQGQNWRFMPNLPVTQFYKVSVDNALPFYNVAGGTQDNNSQVGPSRTDNAHGIRNSDWFNTNEGDGYDCFIDPEDPNTIYSEWQIGGLTRYDRRTSEMVDIQPQPEPGDPPERWNWDAPIVVSPHEHTRLYYASQRVWRSDDRGDSWTAISGDLSRGLDRLKLEYMGATWGADAVWDHGAMSYYGNITTLSESPLVEGFIYAGTDDGLIQVTEDGGQNWRKVEGIKGVPERCFVNKIIASQHDADTVYAAFDNHKAGDFKPYIYKSTDRGATWTSIIGDMPDRHIVWSLAEDHVKPNLLFAAAEYGLFFTIDGGGHWIKLSGGVPTIAFRDVEIQRRENDLVGASFGRGFYILDDYSPLREVSEESLEREAIVFPVRAALLYIPRPLLGRDEKASMGATLYNAENPPFGAEITYYLKDSLATLKDKRQKAERELRKENKPIVFPDWEDLKLEEREERPYLIFTIRDSNDEVVRRLTSPAMPGFNRIVWDLRYYDPTPTRLDDGGRRGFRRRGMGFLVMPGTYSVGLSKYEEGTIDELAEPISFEVTPLNKDLVSDAERAELHAFQMDGARLIRSMMGANAAIEDASNRLRHIKAALLQTPAADPALAKRTREMEIALMDIQETLYGDQTKSSRNEPTSPGVMGRVYTGVFGSFSITSAPTKTHKRSLDIAKQQYGGVLPKLKSILEVDLRALEADIEAAGAPYTPGRPIPDWEQ